MAAAMWFGCCLLTALWLTATAHGRLRIQPRIMGGYTTSIQQTPWLVSIQLDGRHFCGGAILSETIVLTAAHCLEQVDCKDVELRAGSKRYNGGGQLTSISACMVHEKHTSSETSGHDVAVLRLSEPLALGEKVQVIKMAEKEPPDGAVATVSGWGTTEHGSTTVLNAVEVLIWNRYQCAHNYRSIGRITHDMLCASSPGKDSCTDDSGGPLVYKRRLIGIVSWGYNCAEANYPGIYANVAKLRPWIVDAIEKLA